MLSEEKEIILLRFLNVDWKSESVIKQLLFVMFQLSVYNKRSVSMFLPFFLYSTVPILFTCFHNFIFLSLILSYFFHLNVNMKISISFKKSIFPRISLICLFHLHLLSQQLRWREVSNFSFESQKKNRVVLTREKHWTWKKRARSCETVHFTFLLFYSVLISVNFTILTNVKITDNIWRNFL